MAEYVKHTGGSVVGKSKKPYDAMVYKDADSGYTIAVDGSGNVIKKVLSSANTDDVVIQAAITSYAKVMIGPGSFTISSTISIPSNREIYGNGWDSTVLLGTGSITRVVYFNSSNGSMLKNLRVDGASTTSTHGIEILSGVVNRIENVKILSASNYGLRIRGSGTTLYLNNVYIVSSTSYGIGITDNYHGIDAVNVVSELNGNSGIVITGICQAIFTNFWAEQNTGYNIQLGTGSKYVTFINPRLTVSTLEQISIHASSERNTFINPYVNNTTPATCVTISGNNNTFIGGFFDKSIVNTGIRNLIINANYVTEASGTAATITAGNTYVDVTHGLASTPTKVRVTPTTNLGTRSFWVDTKGASTFRVNINSSDVIDHTFDWEAEV